MFTLAIRLQMFPFMVSCRQTIKPRIAHRTLIIFLRSGNIANPMQTKISPINGVLEPLRITQITAQGTASIVSVLERLGVNQRAAMIGHNEAQKHPARIG